MTEITELSNGIKVVLDHMDNLRSVSFGIWVRAGSVNETPESNGAFHAIEHMLFKGTKSRTARQLADDMTRLGGNLNAYTSKECTSYYVTTLDEKITEAIRLMGDMLENSLFDKWELEKEIILDEIDMYDDSPDDLVHEMLQKTIWKDHPLGYLISGEKETVKSFTVQKLIQCKDAFYRAENIVLSVAGHFERSEVLDVLNEVFCNVKKGAVIRSPIPPVYVPCIYRKEKDIEQVHMNLAFDSINYFSDDKYVLSVANAVIGGGDNSRLFQLIREEKGLAYSIYSYDSLFESAGLFHIDTVLNPSRQPEVFEEIMKLVTEFRKHGANEKELICAREQIKTELIIGSESTRGRMSENGKELLFRNFITPVDEVIDRISRVTNEDILNFTARYLDTEHYSMALVGNIGAISA